MRRASSPANPCTSTVARTCLGCRSCTGWSLEYMTAATAGMLSGRRALVLGLDDVGQGIARRVAQEGAHVALCDVHGERCAQRLAAELGDASRRASAIEVQMARQDGLTHGSIED